MMQGVFHQRERLLAGNYTLPDKRDQGDPNHLPGTPNLRSGARLKV